MAFCSSRMLPGHGYSSSRWKASGVSFGSVFAELLGEALDERRDERGDVFAALAQRRDFHLESVQPVVEILPEIAGAEGIGDRAIGRGHEPEIRAGGLGAAERPVLALLEDAQETGLQLGRHLGDLIEEKRAAGRLPAIMPGKSETAPVKAPFT